MTKQTQTHRYLYSQVNVLTKKKNSNNNNNNKERNQYIYIKNNQQIWSPKTSKGKVSQLKQKKINSKNWIGLDLFLPENSPVKGRTIIKPTILINSSKKLKLLFRCSQKIHSYLNLLSFKPLKLLFFLPLHLHLPLSILFTWLLK